MKLGVIADVHADPTALQLALDLLDDHNVDQIVCAGDVMERGPDEKAVVKLLQARTIPCIAGNHDREAQARHSLDGEIMSYLKELPETLTYTLEATRVLIAHGAPWSDFVCVYPTTNRHVFKRVALEANADVVLLGHTHIPMAAQVGSVRIYNPGSVCGKHTGGSSTCGILTLPDCSFQVYQITTGREINVAQVHNMH